MKLIEILTEQKQPMPHLYLDMDGVQCDFFTAWAQWHKKKFGMDHVERYKDIGSKEQREHSIMELTNEGPEFVEHFFANLPELPNYHKLIGWLKLHNIPYTILSAPLRGNNAASARGKMTWLDKHHPGTSSTAIFRGDKERMAKKGGVSNVLIDDHKKNIENWDAAGGKGILYRDNNVDATIERLEDIYGPYLNK